MRQFMGDFHCGLLSDHRVFARECKPSAIAVPSLMTVREPRPINYSDRISICRYCHKAHALCVPCMSPVNLFQSVKSDRSTRPLLRAGCDTL